MKRRNAEIHPFPVGRALQNANQNAYQGMRKQGILQPARALTRVAGHLQGAAEVLDALLQDQDRLAPGLTADLNEAAGLIFEALQRVAESGLVAVDGDEAGPMPHPAANLR